MMKYIREGNEKASALFIIRQKPLKIWNTALIISLKKGKIGGK